MPTIIADSGPLIALLNARDAHHAWAVREIRPLPKPWITCAAALIETTHLLGNDIRVLGALRKLLAELNVVEPAPAEVLTLMEDYAPRAVYFSARRVSRLAGG